MQPEAIVTTGLELVDFPRVRPAAHMKKFWRIEKFFFFFFFLGIPRQVSTRRLSYDPAMFAKERKEASSPRTPKSPLHQALDAVCLFSLTLT